MYQIHKTNNGAPGQVMIFYGPLRGELSDADADALIRWDVEGAQLGYSISFIPDLDGDLLPDLLIGAPCAGCEDPGAAFVWTGAPTGTVTIEDAAVRLNGGALDGRAGWRSQSAGDTDGDGVAELLVPECQYGDGTASVVGRVFVVAQPVESTLQLEDVAPYVVGERELQYAGTAVSALGDTNHDGYGDFLVGATGDWELGTRGGKAWLVTGPVTQSGYLADSAASFSPERDYEWLGAEVAGAGDLDGDGNLEIAISAPRDYYYGRDDYPGKVYIFTTPLLGSYSGADADLVLQGQGIGDYTGGGMVGGRDVDADGRPDLLIGAPFNTQGGKDAGKVVLLTGFEW